MPENRLKNYVLIHIIVINLLCSSTNGKFMTVDTNLNFL